MNCVVVFYVGNLYMDSRQSMSMMGPPGYPHMPPMSTTGPTMTGEGETEGQSLCSASFPPFWSHCLLFPLQDITHRWTSSPWYLLETSRCIACQPMTSRMILIGTPSSSPSQPSRSKKVEARGSPAETDCRRTGRGESTAAPPQKNVQRVLGGKTPFKVLQFLQKRNITTVTLKTIIIFSGTRSSGCFCTCLGTGRARSL